MPGPGRQASTLLAVDFSAGTPLILVARFTNLVMPTGLNLRRRGLS